VYDWDMEEMKPQIKSKDRVRGLAEVYTAPREVNAMCDLIPYLDNAWIMVTLYGVSGIG